MMGVQRYEMVRLGKKTSEVVEWAKCIFAAGCRYEMVWQSQWDMWNSH